MRKPKTSLTTPKMSPPPPSKHGKYKCLEQKHHPANLRGTGLRLFKCFFRNLKARVSLLAYGERHKGKVKAHLTTKDQGKRLPSKGRNSSNAPALISQLRIQLAKGAARASHSFSDASWGQTRHTLDPGEQIIVKIFILAGNIPANTCLHEPQH